MARLAFTALALACFTTEYAAASDPRVVPMKIGRHQKRGTIQKRDPLQVDITNAVSEALYYVNVSVGTPGQTVSLQLDTGSSDLWMFGPNACSGNSTCKGGTFDPSKSSSSSLIAQDAFEIQYVTPGSDVKGDYISDNVALGGQTIKNLTMAVAKEASSVNTGIMGIDFDTRESLVSQGYSPYPNIIDVMATSGLIKSRAYSLWLDDLTDSSGTILFGGYDTSKYEGDLVILPIQPDADTGDFSSMTVAWTSLAVTDNTGSTLLTPDDFPLPAVLDSGTTFTILPQDLFEQLFEYFGAVQDPTYGNLVACNISQASGSVDFGFGDGPFISVPFSEFAVPGFDNQGNPITYDDGTQACQFGIDQSPDGSSILLGDTFLRSAYVVYDLDQLQIGIAQTNFNSSQSNIVEISNGTNPIASAVSTATGVTAALSATGIVAPGVTGAAPSLTGSSGTHPTSVRGIGQVSGVKTSLPVKTFAGATATGTKAPSSTSSKSSAATDRPAPIKIVNMLFVCWTTVAVVAGGAAFSYLL